MDRQKKDSREHLPRALLDLAPQPPTLELIPSRQVERMGMCEQISHFLDLMHLHSDTSKSSMTGFPSML